MGIQAKNKIFLVFFISSILISCSSSQSGSPFGDFKETPCEGDNCSSKIPTPEPSFERDDNSDIILDKYDNALELNGKCRIKDLPDSEIQIQVTAEGGSPRTLVDGYVPIIGITSSGNRMAKCEKGRWALVINACNNLIGVAGAHRIVLTLKGKDKNGRFVEFPDGQVTLNFIRANTCDASVL